MDNYPMDCQPGSLNWERAPWNQPEPPPCPECEGDMLQATDGVWTCVECQHEEPSDVDH